ncbi:MAG TPA: cob(I)yrinic acid a,c-diamide adenosyltransferase [Blastocatellia bacterium]|nr:cob(I)yrinic acid a,c-diamide adenosyltransferase [Blastocatellia bacterium]
MRISKVYTRGGDGGETSLVGGERVSKASRRVDAYGDVDELNSVIGLARAHLTDSEIDDLLARIQNELFTVGGDLASPSGVEVPRVDQLFVTRLEEAADHYLAQLEPLREFVLPGGSIAGATLHLARTVARRAERKVVALSEAEEITPDALVYLNRLSDLLFILARAVNQREAAAERMTDFSRQARRG